MNSEVNHALIDQKIHLSNIVISTAKCKFFKLLDTVQVSRRDANRYLITKSAKKIIRQKDTLFGAKTGSRDVEIREHNKEQLFFTILS